MKTFKLFLTIVAILFMSVSLDAQVKNDESLL